MGDATPEEWLTQEVQEHLLDFGQIGLYELRWLLNGSNFELTATDTSAVSMRVAIKLLETGLADLFTLTWPDFRVVEGPLSPSILNDEDTWHEYDEFVALMPTGIASAAPSGGGPGST